MVDTYQHRHTEGFTFVGILIIIALSGIGLGIVGDIWHHANQREKEKELLFIGNQYHQALVSYYESTPGGVKQYPRNLEELVLDKRFPSVKRHIRRLYLDPMQPDQPWGLVKQQDFIIGVHSNSTKKPIKKVGFAERYTIFSQAKTYADWKFIANN